MTRTKQTITRSHERIAAKRRTMRPLNTPIMYVYSFKVRQQSQHIQQQHKPEYLKHRRQEKIVLQQQALHLFEYARGPIHLTHSHIAHLRKIRETLRTWRHGIRATLSKSTLCIRQTYADNNMLTQKLLFTQKPESVRFRKAKHDSVQHTRLLNATKRIHN